MMDEQRYRVVFSGRLREGKTAAEVKQNLARMYRLPPEKLERYFSGRPTVLRKDLTAAQAEETRQAFERAGAVVRVESLESTRSAAAQPEQAPQPPAPQPPPPSSVATPLSSESADRQARPAPAVAPPPQPRPDPVMPPVLETSSVSLGGLFGLGLRVGLLNLILIGIVVGPRMVWDFLLGHVSINGRRLGNDDLWLGLRPLLWAPISLAFLIALAIPVSLVMGVIGMVSKELADDMSVLIGIPVLVVLCAPFQIGFLHSLIAHTETVEGRKVFRELFSLDLYSAIDFAKSQWKFVLLAGVTVVAAIFMFTIPIAIALTWTQLFNQLEVDSHRFRVEIPWRKAAIYSALCIPTFGLASLAFLSWLISDHLPTGQWRPSRRGGRYRPRPRQNPV